MMWWVKFSDIVYPKRIIYAKITGIVLWATWLASLIFGSGNFDLAGQVVGTDYIQFYSAGLTLRMGKSTQLYNFSYQYSLENEIIGPELTNYHAFITPPLFATLYVPFSLLPYNLSFILWSILCLLILWLSIFSITGGDKWRYFLWSLLWFPVFASISFGQNSILSLAILSFVYLSWFEKKYLLSGFIASLLFYKPQLIVGILILWIFEFKIQRKALLGLTIGSAVMLFLNILFFPDASQSYINFVINELPSMISDKQFPIWHMHTIRGFINLLLPGRLAIADVLYLSSVILFSFAFYKFFTASGLDRKVLYAGTICYTLLVSPHVMIYDWSLLLIPAILLWRNNESPKPLLISIFAIMWVAALVSGPLTFYQLNYLSIGIQISIPIFIFSTIILFEQLSENAPEISHQNA